MDGPSRRHRGGLCQRLFHGTLCGLAAARCEMLRRLDWDVNADGLFGVPPIRVIVSEQAHRSVFKTLANIQASGVCWCGGTEWNGEPAIRISVSSWVTTPDDVSRSVNAFVDARAKALAASDPAD
jgi:hypothetical protein